MNESHCNGLLTHFTFLASVLTSVDLKMYQDASDRSIFTYVCNICCCSRICGNSPSNSHPSRARWNCGPQMAYFVSGCIQGWIQGRKLSWQHFAAINTIVAWAWYELQTIFVCNYWFSVGVHLANSRCSCFWLLQRPLSAGLKTSEPSLLGAGNLADTGSSNRDSSSSMSTISGAKKDEVNISIVPLLAIRQ